ncbi:hypothetical protein D1J51_12060 [Leucobacter sp. wl10]|nr:hypothetical protein D1J51_12060 [Leucobacter sp. wl10]
MISTSPARGHQWCPNDAPAQVDAIVAAVIGVPTAVVAPRLRLCLCLCLCLCLESLLLPMIAGTDAVGHLPGLLGPDAVAGITPWQHRPWIFLRDPHRIRQPRIRLRLPPPRTRHSPTIGPTTLIQRYCR